MNANNPHDPLAGEFSFDDLFEPEVTRPDALGDGQSAHEPSEATPTPGRSLPEDPDTMETYEGEPVDEPEVRERHEDEAPSKSDGAQSAENAPGERLARNAAPPAPSAPTDEMGFIRLMLERMDHQISVLSTSMVSLAERVELAESGRADRALPPAREDREAAEAAAREAAARDEAARRQAEAERHARIASELAARDEAERQAREAAEAAARDEAERQAREAAEAAARDEAERQAREAAEAAARDEAERQAREAAEAAARDEAQRQAREAAEAAARDEAERQAREAAEAAARDEAERQAREAAEAAARDEAERQAREAAEAAARDEAERQAREAAEAAARDEAERQAREAAEAAARDEAERQAREAAEAAARDEAERQAREAAEAAARDEAERQAREAAEAAARDEAERQAREAAEAAARDEAERQAREAAEAAAREEAERQAREAAEAAAREEAERQAREAAEAAAREEAERQAREAAEAAAREEAERQAREAAEAAAREEAERQAREAAEAAAREEAERQAREAAEAAAREEAERQAREAAETAARDEAQRQAREAAEAAARDEAQRQAREAAEAAARDEAQRQAREAAEAAARDEAQRQAREAAEAAARDDVSAFGDFEPLEHSPFGEPVSPNSGSETGFRLPADSPFATQAQAPMPPGAGRRPSPQVMPAEDIDDYTPGYDEEDETETPDQQSQSASSGHPGDPMDMLVRIAIVDPDTEADIQAKQVVQKVRAEAIADDDSRKARGGKQKVKLEPLPFDALVPGTPLVGTIFSPSGGVGKSSTAMNLAVYIAAIADAMAKKRIQRGEQNVRVPRVLLLDGDVVQGSLALRLKGALTPNMHELMMYLDDRRDQGFEGPDRWPAYYDEAPEPEKSMRDFVMWPDVLPNLNLLAAPHEPDLFYDFGPKEYREILQLLGRWYDVVIIDSGTEVIMESNRAWLQHANEVFLITAPEIDRVYNASKSARYIAKRRPHPQDTSENPELQPPLTPADRLSVIMTRYDADSGLDVRALMDESFPWLTDRPEQKFWVPDVSREMTRANNTSRFLVLENPAYAKVIGKLAKHLFVRYAAQKQRALPSAGATQR